MSEISCNITGKGPALVLLHGFCESKEIWDEFATALSDEYTVICPDLPGFGASKSLAHVTMETLAEAVFKFLSGQKITEFVIVGHSLGGYVALALAEHNPIAIKGLGLFHSTSFPDSPEKKETRNKTAEFAKNNGVEAFIRPFVPPLFYPGNRERCKKDIEKLVEIGLKTPLQSIIDTTLAMRDRPDRTHVLSEAKYPILSIIGKNDGAVKLEDSLAQIHLPYKSYVQILGDTAHQGLFEKKEETIKMVRAFCESVYSS